MGSKVQGPNSEAGLGVFSMGYQSRGITVGQTARRTGYNEVGREISWKSLATL